MADALTAGISKLSLRPGDVLVVSLPVQPSHAQIDRLAATVQSRLPAGVNVLFKAKDAELTVLRFDKPVEPEVDEATIVTVEP